MLTNSFAIHVLRAQILHRWVQSRLQDIASASDASRLGWFHGINYVDFHELNMKCEME